MSTAAGWRQRRRDVVMDDQEAQRVRETWVDACAGAGLSHTTQTPVGPTITTPRPMSVQLGPPVRILVRLLPGQLPADVRKAARRVAPSLGAVGLRVQPAHVGHVWVTLLDHDPLAGIVRPEQLGAGDGEVLGQAEDGLPVWADLVGWPHALFTGATTAGKSTGVRWLLAQLAGRPDVRVIGSDPSGTLWRPWPADPDRVTGLRDIGEHVAMLERATLELDRRLELIPFDRDRVATSPELPCQVIVAEEWPATLRVAGAAGKATEAALRGHMSRLLAESHKAGMRVWVLTQRADTAILGGFERSNLGVRVSWASDREGLRMTHPAAPADLADDHASAAPGIALLAAPGAELQRLRFPLLEFAEYAQLVRRASPR